MSNLFQDVNGTAVTADGQPVGLVLDSSRDGALGSELVVNGTFDTDSDWTDTSTGTGTAVIENGVATLTGDTFPNRANLVQVVPTTIGKTYTLSISISQANGAYVLYQANGNNVVGGLDSPQNVLITFVGH